MMRPAFLVSDHLTEGRPIHGVRGVISSVLYKGKWIKNQESTLFIVIMRHGGRQCMK
jgi:hypothetical protein